MNITASLLLALCVLGTAATAAEPVAAPVPGAASTSGVVEEVVSSREGAYHGTAYVVSWNGQRVLVDDPLDVHDKMVGDSLHYLVARNSTADGRQLLAFISLERAAAQPIAAAARPGENTAATTTGVVEEVLHAQDGGYRFIAYIARLGDERVAVWDTLAQSHYAIGESIPILQLRLASSAGALLHFQINPGRLPQTAASQAPAAPAALGSGSIEQVLSATSQGYANRTYIVRWHGSEVPVEDPTEASDYQAGDSLEFRILRSPLPGAGGAGIMRLVLQAPPGGAADESTSLQSSSVTEAATVERVLAWHDGADRAIAYLVRWHGVPVAVTDEFATTSFAPGDRIEFSVVRGSGAAGKDLQFMMFVFPGMPRAGHP